MPGKDEQIPSSSHCYKIVALLARQHSKDGFEAICLAKLPRHGAGAGVLARKFPVSPCVNRSVYRSPLSINSLFTPYFNKIILIINVLIRKQVEIDRLLVDIFLFIIN